MRKKADEEAAARKRAEEERERVKKEAEGAAQKVYTYMRTLTVQRFVHTCIHACIHSFIHRSLHIQQHTNRDVLHTYTCIRFVHARKRKIHCMHAWMHVRHCIQCIYLDVRACIHTVYIHAHVHASVRPHVRLFKDTCIRTFTYKHR